MKNTLLMIITLIIALLLCACGKGESNVSYVTEQNTVTQPNNVTEQPKQEQPVQEQPEQKKGVYKGILSEYYGFGTLAPSDFELKYGAADKVSEGERTTVIMQGNNRFEFNSRGLYYASISDSAFKGPGGISCGMTLEKTINTFLPEYASAFDFESDEFQSLFGESYYDEYMGVTLISPYCVFYRQGVENATEDSAYLLEYSVSSDKGAEKITMYFSIDKILTAYSMQLV